METIRRWTAEPPPDYLFEVSETCVAQSSPRMATATSRLHKLAPRAVVPSPSAPNITQPQVLRDALNAIAKAGSRQATAALVIPDYAVRMSILDFEQFPENESERLALLRFRLRKSVPFPIDEAQLSYAIQHREPALVEVLAVAIARPILDEYEQAFSEFGFRVGLVTPSSIAALPLFRAESDAALTLVLKMAGNTASVLLIQRGRLRLVRSIDLTSSDLAPGDSFAGDEAGILPGIVQQTLAYAEDQLGSTVDRLLVCGSTDSYGQLETMALSEFGIPMRSIRSRFGQATPENAGLLGLMEQYA